MHVIADILLFAAAVGAAVYCHVLAGRLRALTTLEAGMGNAIAVLSVQVDEMRAALAAAQSTAQAAETRLRDLTGRAESAETQLSLMLAALHDLPPAPLQPMPQAPAEAAVRRVRVLRRRAGEEVAA
jgi:outer membrane protein TolC